MSEQEMVDVLLEAIDLYQEEHVEGRTPDEEVEVAGTFEDVGLMTMNKGLVIRAGDSEFQITVVRSR